MGMDQDDVCGGISILCGMAVSVVAAHQGRFPFTVSIPSIALSLVFSAAIGIGFGFYRVRKATHLNPIEALHAE